MAQHSDVPRKIHGIEGAVGDVIVSQGPGVVEQWAAPAAGPAQANQAALEAETNENTYAPPDLIKHSPGVAKAYVQIAADGASFVGAYNVASVTDTGDGDRTIVWDDDFSNGNYTVISGIMANLRYFCNHGTNVVGSTRLIIETAAGTDTDETTGTVALGDQ